MRKTKRKYTRRSKLLKNVKSDINILDTQTNPAEPEQEKQPTTVDKKQANCLQGRPELATPNFEEQANRAEREARQTASVSVYDFNIVKYAHKIELKTLKSVIDNLKSRIQILLSEIHINREIAYNRKLEINKLNEQVALLSQEKDRLSYVTTHLNEVKEYQAKEIAKLTRKLNKIKQQQRRKK